MPTPVEVRYGEYRCRFSRDELRAHGLLWEQYYGDWESEDVVDIQPGTDSHGTAKRITFKHGDEFWQVLVGYHHEDWQGTNDLREGFLEAVRVEPHVVTQTVYRAVSAT